MPKHSKGFQPIRVQEWGYQLHEMVPFSFDNVLFLLGIPDTTFKCAILTYSNYDGSQGHVFETLSMTLFPFDPCRSIPQGTWKTT